jgi:hypothetical protein
MSSGRIDIALTKKILPRFVFDLHITIERRDQGAIDRAPPPTVILTIERGGVEARVRPSIEERDVGSRRNQEYTYQSLTFLFPYMQIKYRQREYGANSNVLQNYSNASRIMSKLNI